MNPPCVKVPAAVGCMEMLFPPPASGTQEREYPVITPLRKVGAGGDQENVMFLAPGVTVKLCGGPVGAGNKNILDGNGHNRERTKFNSYVAQCSKVKCKVSLGDKVSWITSERKWNAVDLIGQARLSTITKSFS